MVSILKSALNRVHPVGKNDPIISGHHDVFDSPISVLIIYMRLSLDKTMMCSSHTEGFMNSQIYKFVTVVSER